MQCNAWRRERQDYRTPTMPSVPGMVLRAGLHLGSRNGHARNGHARWFLEPRRNHLACLDALPARFVDFVDQPSVVKCEVSSDKKLVPTL